MYLDYFSLTNRPFSISPDPSFLFPSVGHQEALAHLQYTLSNHGGLVALTGEVGMGKTMLCRAFIESLDEQTECAYIFNPQMSACELLINLCQELHIQCPQSHSIQELTQVLFAGLLDKYSKGKRVLCIIDEAQSMPLVLLEQIRLLTNLETSEHKLLTLILVGQTELAQILNQHTMRQLNQRITARYHLNALNTQEIQQYIAHRMRHCGSQNNPFSQSAMQAISKYSRGIPRLINSLADRALLGAYAQNKKIISSKIIHHAAREILGSGSSKKLTKSSKLGLVSGALIIGVLVISVTFLQLPTVETNEQVLEENPLPEQQLAQAYQLKAESCEQIATLNWQCLPLDWRLPELQKLQRPVMIQTTQGWQSLGANRQGQYLNKALILWQPPAHYTSFVRPGSRSQVVQWVRNKLQLTMFNWKTIGPAKQPKKQALEDFYDPILARAVGDFQREMGILSDQIIGPQTLLYLQEKDQ